jgi:hypothetical protein
MALAEKYSKMDVYTNADTPRDAKKARELGAHGIGLCRTEHMFFEGDRIKAMREMIIAPDEASRRIALGKLLPLQRGDFEGIFEAMDGYEVTIRLLDPPLHEFVPHQLETMRELAEQTGRTLEEVKLVCDGLEEFNPMLGHRGCRIRSSMFALQTRAPYLLRIPFTGRYSVRLNRFWYHFPGDHRYADPRYPLRRLRTEAGGQEYESKASVSPIGLRNSPKPSMATS